MFELCKETNKSVCFVEKEITKMSIKMKFIDAVIQRILQKKYLYFG